MSNSREEETYSTIFTSLKHPIRRKILRMLYESPKSFSEMQETFRIESSHLTYHLENLKELIYKTDDGRYKLSTFGDAAVTTMSKVEEAPRNPSLSIKWKSIFVVLTIGLVLLSGVSCIQYVSLNKLSAEFEQLSIENQQLSARLHSLDIQELALVQLTGDIITRNGATIFYVNRSSDCCTPRCVFVHSDWGEHLPFMHVETTPGLWSTNDTHHLGAHACDFTGDQEGKLQFHIDKMRARMNFTQNTWVIYRFGEYTQEDVDEGTIIDKYVGWRKYQLEVQGQWEGESMPYGTITVDDMHACKISQMFFTPVSAGKWKGGTYGTFHKVWTGRLSFTVTIDPLK